MKLYSISTEIIKYQNNDSAFIDKLTSIVQNLYKDIGIDYENNSDDKNSIKMNLNEAASKSVYLKQLIDEIRSRFNINLIYDKELAFFTPIAIIPFLTDKVFLLNKDKSVNFISIKKRIIEEFETLDSYEKALARMNKIYEDKKKILKELHGKHGYIDLKNAKLGGYLSEVPHYLILNFVLINSIKFTPKELLAGILHEVGHAFAGLEYHHRLFSTNITIMDIINELNNNNKDKVKYIFNSKFDSDFFTKSSLDTKEEINDFYGELARQYMEVYRSQFNNNSYDHTSFENLADSFATRFNLGGEIVKGLAKMDSSNYYIAYKQEAIYYNIYNIIITILFLLFFIIIFNVFGIILFIMFMKVSFGNINDIYDTSLARFNRIKNSIVNNLKDMNISPKLTKDLIEQYMLINDIMNQFVEIKIPLEVVSSIIFSSRRNGKYYINLQKEIENGLNNSLFVKAAQVRIS